MEKSRSSLAPGPVKRAASATTLPPIKRPVQVTAPSRGIYGRQWTTEHHRYLHEKRERSWLKQQGKHGQMDFSELERTELRRYFEAIAEAGDPKQRKIRVDRLEDMLISLGLAQNRREVEEIVQAIDDKESGELDFEQYLTIVRTCADPAIFQVFKAMIDGKLGDTNLNFRTVISGYRRNMMMDATGAREASANVTEAEEVKKRGSRILNNFATLQAGRYERGEKRGDRGEKGEDLLPFDGSGFVPTGGMQMLWHTVCQEHSLVPSRPASADKRTLEPPRSPTDIIDSIVHANQKRGYGRKRGTLVISAPEQSMSKSASAPDFMANSRPTSKQGERELVTRDYKM